MLQNLILLPNQSVDFAQPLVRSVDGHPCITLFKTCVICKSPGREHIWLLRNFKESLFFKHHNDKLTEEDNKLEQLNQQTKEWWGRISELYQNAYLRLE